MKMVMTALIGSTSLTSGLGIAPEEELTFTHDTFEMDESLIYEQLIDVQDKTMDVVMTTNYARPLDELKMMYDVPLAETIHHQYNQDAYIQDFNWDHYTIVDQLLHNDFEDIYISTTEDREHVVTVHTSSIEDGAGNRAQFIEEYVFTFNEDLEHYVISDINIEQTF
ncbi:hypothetical protein [Geomicrobium sediminis]|uniref:Uncharacterized protein n=1 Tax=Geomicrobium sediminis TaxID=1347788 RepID=A0ABS2P9D9_9BACL|nr:hypothetical protein [Geomicrobium sediminis]MBM7631976.1 hypothetical protein [Geomicrobium sediminis]